VQSEIRHHRRAWFQIEDNELIDGRNGLATDQIALVLVKTCSPMLINPNDDSNNHIIASLRIGLGSLAICCVEVICCIHLIHGK